jgi:hypothetical protein
MENNKKERATLPRSIGEGVLSVEEAFQNETIRPIVKTQSALLKRFVISQLEFMKVNFEQLNELKKKQSLAALILKNQQFKREIIGIIIGQFSLDEFEIYLTMRKEINRRITQIIHNRMIDQLT